MRLRILNLDGSLPCQPGLAAALDDGSAQCVALRDEEHALRLWATGNRMRRLATRLAMLEPPPGDGPLVTFYGSGDYHHLATTMIAAAAEPVTVIHFDNHPDWVRVPATHNCGGWVNRALSLPQVVRVVTLGICSEDLVRPQIKTGNVAALASGRLELHAWRAQPSRVWGRIGNGAGHRQIGNRLVWSCLADQDWGGFLHSLVARLPTAAIWVTVDKDVLRPADAVTNWDQGEMPLDALLCALELLALTCRIVGVDICGEYSVPQFDDPLKRLAARLDQPRAKSVPLDAVARNDGTNRALIKTLAKVLP